MEMMIKGLDRLVMSLKSKLGCFTPTGGSTSSGNCYNRYISNSGDGYTKVEKTESTRVEMKSMRARELIAETLKMADSRSSKTFWF